MTNKPVKLPEAGQWPDKVAPWALLAGIVLSTLGFLHGVSVRRARQRRRRRRRGADRRADGCQQAAAVPEDLLLPYAGGLGVVRARWRSRVITPCASWLPKTSASTRARRSCMEIALVFVVCTMITGDLWDALRVGRVVDVGAAPDDLPHPHAHRHRVLRAAQRHRRPRALAARTPPLLGIIAMVDVPICFMVTRLIPSGVHPVVAARGRHVRRYGHDARGRVLGGPYARRVRAVPFPLPPGPPAASACRPSKTQVEVLEERR